MDKYLESINGITISENQRSMGNDSAMVKKLTDFKALPGDLVCLGPAIVPQAAYSAWNFQ